MKKWVGFILGCTSTLLVAQQNPATDDLINLEMDSIDSLALNLNQPIDLDEMKFYALNLDSDLEKKYYHWLQRRVKDVYPYVRKAVTEYYAVKDSAEKISSKRKRRKFIKKRYKELADGYEEKLKNLSTSRGQILSKFIHRETGLTSYEIIKELRGGFNAFMWNAAGGAFDIDLKQAYNPETSREDLFLEVILQKFFTQGVLEPIRRGEAPPEDSATVNELETQSK